MFYILYIYSTYVVLSSNYWVCQFFLNLNEEYYLILQPFFHHLKNSFSICKYSCILLGIIKDILLEINKLNNSQKMSEDDQALKKKAVERIDAIRNNKFK